jgi:hypothetical protein
MSSKETAAMLPEQGPDPLTISLWQIEAIEFRSRKEFKPSLAMGRRQGFQPSFDLEQKHEPMRLTLVTTFADQSGQVEVPRPQAQSSFFSRFATGAGVRRFTARRIELSAARTPQATVGLAASLQQQYFVTLVETEQERRDLVRQLHANE